MITDSFIVKFLTSLGLNITPNRVNFLRAWNASENASATNNPFATTWDMSIYGATPYNNNKPPVQNYPNEDLGVRANVQTIQQSNFKPILDALKTDAHIDTLMGPVLDKTFNLWGTGGKLLASTYSTRFKNTPVNVTELKKKVMLTVPCPNCGAALLLSKV